MSAMAEGGNDERIKLLKGSVGDGNELLEKYGTVIKDRMENLKQQILDAADEDILQVEQSRRHLLHQVQRMMEEFDYKLREVGVGFMSRMDNPRIGCFSGLQRLGSMEVDDRLSFMEEHLNEVLDLMSDIQFNRENSNSKLCIGHIVQPKILRLASSINLPETTGHPKRSLTALPDGSVAIGHDTGGVDIFHPDFGIKRFVDDVTVRDIAACSDGKVLVLSFDRHIHVFDNQGKAVQTLSPQETCFMFSLSVDRGDILFVGDCELEKIFVFNLKRDAPTALRTIPTAANTPWQLHVLSTGQLLVADPCPPYGPSIKLIDQAGSTVTAIHQEEWSSAWCTVDRDDNIYVAFAKKGIEKRISIDIYSSDGKVVENLTRNLMMPKFQWLSVAVPSPGTIAICNETHLFVYSWRSQYH
ncbi:uncharacterized protein [Diadema setosum]|uniref:uncharacterized protein n=1 Tax=Diadema setosum TaxID=31175 RepID=UPI003B3B03BB